MTDPVETPADAAAAQPTWRDLTRDGRAVYSLLVFLGVARTSVTLFPPLLFQVVHGVGPLS